MHKSIDENRLVFFVVFLWDDLLNNLKNELYLVSPSLQLNLLQSNLAGKSDCPL